MQELIQKTTVYRLLRQERADGRLNHAYLLLYSDRYALRDVLKRYAAVIYGCNQADRVAKLIESETFADCLILPAQGAKYSVETVREVAERCQTAATEGGITVVVLDKAHTMSEAVQNKLLKLLEEPPADVVFLLGAESEAPLLPTVLSRVKKLTLPPFRTEDVSEYLKRTVPHLADADEIALAADGKIGVARMIAEGERYHELSAGAAACVASEGEERILALKKWGETDKKEEFLSMIRFVYRDALMIKLRADQNLAVLALPKQRHQSQKVADRLSVFALVEAQDIWAQAERRLAQYASFAQLIETSVLSVERIDRNRKENL